MRIVHRLKQYEKLYARLIDQPSQVNVATLAIIFSCSERHVRTLIKNFECKGWVEWKSCPGRGNKSLLKCLQTPAQIKKLIIREMLDSGASLSALRVAFPDDSRLMSVLLAPHMGGQWHASTPTLRIPFYRELSTLQPLKVKGRTEEHFCRNIHAGLTRFETGTSFPQPDLAHHWSHTKQGTRWDFMLHAGLCWHDGSDITTNQILVQLQRLQHHRVSAFHFKNVVSITVPHVLCIRFELAVADFWFPYRLATMQCLLTHPDSADMGAGPFKVEFFNHRFVRLEKHKFYHLRHPYIEHIECWADLQGDAPEEETDILASHILIGKPSQQYPVQPAGKQTSAGCCYMAINLKRKWLRREQAQWLKNYVHRSGIISRLPVESDVIKETNALLPGWPDLMNPNREMLVPARLKLLYKDQPELISLAEQLNKELKAYGCDLQIQKIAPDDGLAQFDGADMILGDCLIGDAPEATLEMWLRRDLFWLAFLTAPDLHCVEARLHEAQTESNQDARNAIIRQLFSWLMQKTYLTPLFNYHYQISTVNQVNNIKMTAYGWFDFCEAWISPDI